MAVFQISLRLAAIFPIIAVFALMFLPATVHADTSKQVASFIDYENRIIRLTHVPCQIVEAENSINHQFDVWHESHCRRINKQTGKDRLAAAAIPEIPEGRWTFIVQNQNVAWKVGFWLRAERVSDRLSLPKAELSGYLSAGEEGQVTVVLKAGNYVYSCPYNPTLPYKLAVTTN